MGRPREPEECGTGDGRDLKCYVKKVALLGDPDVGKKALAARVAFSDFDDAMVNMLGTKISKYGVKLSFPDYKIRLSIMMWDLTGREAFDLVRPRYLAGVEGIIVAGDLSRIHTIERMELWASRATDVIKKPVPIVFIGNKSDIVDEPGLIRARDILDMICTRFNSNYYITSVTTGENIREPFLALGRAICHNQVERNRKTLDGTAGAISSPVVTGEGRSSTNGEKVEVDGSRSIQGDGIGAGTDARIDGKNHTSRGRGDE